MSTRTAAREQAKDAMPFLFPKQAIRVQEGLPSKIAQQWSEMSHFFFFNNGLTSKGSIRRFLQAQTIARLDDIAFAFDIVGDDMVSELERKEGMKLQEKHRDMIIEGILASVTR